MNLADSPWLSSSTWLPQPCVPVTKRLTKFTLFKGYLNPTLEVLEENLWRSVAHVSAGRMPFLYETKVCQKL